MASITATFAKNNIGEVWEMARNEPVEVRRDGVPVAMIVSPDYFAEMHRQQRPRLGRPRRIGILADKLGSRDFSELLGVDVGDLFRDYVPE